MKRILILAFFLALFPLSHACCGQMDNILNSSVVASTSDKSFTLSNVPIDGKNYYGTWRLTDSFDFALNSVGETVTVSGIDFLKAYRQHNQAVDVGRDDPALQGFEPVSDGCNSYFFYMKDGTPLYLCEGDNFFKVLGKRAENYTVLFKGFKYPSFLPVNSAFSGVTEIEIVTPNGNRPGERGIFTLSVRESDDGSAWLVFYTYSSSENFLTSFSKYDKVSLGLMDEKRRGWGPWPAE